MPNIYIHDLIVILEWGITSVDRVRLAIAASDSNCTMTSISMYHSNKVFVPPAEWIFIRASYSNIHYYDMHNYFVITYMYANIEQLESTYIHTYIYIHIMQCLHLNNFTSSKRARLARPLRVEK